MIDSLEYNSERIDLIIPEYGRHIQKMVNQAVECENKSERNNMAKAIIGVMGNLNPHLRDVADFQHKLWDQLFIMSEFKLDVDSPFPKPEKELLEEKYFNNQQYRKIKKNLIAKIAEARINELSEKLHSKNINLKKLIGKTNLIFLEINAPNTAVIKRPEVANTKS